MSEAIPDEFWQGVEQFNKGEFYACHDTLEALWMEAAEPEKRFYQGILQIAVALYHLGNNNYRGAIILLGEGISRLRNYQPIYYNIDVEKLLERSVQILSELQQAEPEKIAEWVAQMKSSKTESDRILNLPKLVKIS